MLILSDNLLDVRLFVGTIAKGARFSLFAVAQPVRSGLLHLEPHWTQLDLQEDILMGTVAKWLTPGPTTEAPGVEFICNKTPQKLNKTSNKIKTPIPLSSSTLNGFLS